MGDLDILEPGTLLFGYRVLKLAGHGAWAYVYKAEHPSLPRYVAIKQLRPVWAANEDALQRFLREAQIVGQLNHPNIVTIHDLLQDKATGTWYIITEFAEKGTLANRLEESAGGLPIDEVCRIAMGICSGLEVVHQSGVIHRDVKPGNILMVDVGESQDIPKLSDFGIAREAVIPSTLVPRSLVAYGSVHYMSPERLDTYIADDHRCDLYSLGITLYELLTGQVPFTGTEIDIFWDHLYIRPRPPGDLRTGIPKALERIVLQALQKDPQLRYQSAAEMREALEAVQNPSLDMKRQATFQTLLAQGMAHLEKGELEDAKEALKQANVLEPGNEKVRVGLQRISKQQKLTPLYVEAMDRMMADEWVGAKSNRRKQVAPTLLLLALIVFILFLVSVFLPELLRFKRMLIPGITPTRTRVSMLTTTATTMVTAQATESYTPPPTNTPTHTGTPTNTPTHTGTPTNTPTHTGTPTNTPTPTLTATLQLTGPITLTIYLRDTRTETGFAALSADQPNGGMIYEEGKCVYGEAAVQIGETTYHFDKPKVEPGEPEELPDPWRVEFEFAKELKDHTRTAKGDGCAEGMPGFDRKKAQFWVGILSDQSAVGEDSPYSLTMKLYEQNELRESIQVFFTVADAPESPGHGGGTPTWPVP